MYSQTHRGLHTPSPTSGAVPHSRGKGRWLQDAGKIWLKQQHLQLVTLSQHTNKGFIQPKSLFFMFFLLALKRFADWFLEHENRG